MLRRLEHENAVFRVQHCTSCQASSHDRDNCTVQVCYLWRSGHTQANCDKLKCDSCGQYGHFNLQCAAYEHCNDLDHSSSTCPNSIRCRRCEGFGHKAVDCPDESSMECHACHETGHMARDCLTKPPSNCRACGETGRFARDCPQKVVICYACGENGHTKSLCLKKQSLQCTACGYMGHVAITCKQSEQGAGGLQDGSTDGVSGGSLLHKLTGLQLRQTITLNAQQSAIFRIQDEAMGGDGTGISMGWRLSSGKETAYVLPDEAPQEENGFAAIEDSEVVSNETAGTAAAAPRVDDTNLDSERDSDWAGSDTVNSSAQDDWATTPGDTTWEQWG